MELVVRTHFLFNSRDMLAVGSVYVPQMGNQPYGGWRSAVAVHRFRRELIWALHPMVVPDHHYAWNLFFLALCVNEEVGNETHVICRMNLGWCGPLGPHPTNKNKLKKILVRKSKWQEKRHVVIIHRDKWWRIAKNVGRGFAKAAMIC